MKVIEKTITSLEVAEMDNPKVVYLFLASDGTLKVGITKDLKARKSAISNQSGKEIIQIFSTEYCSNAIEIEKDFKLAYRDFKLKGEWYQLGYETAKTYIENSYKEKAVIKPRNKERELYKAFDKLLDFIFE